MAKVRTKTLMSFRKGGKHFTQEFQPCSYAEALALEQDDRLEVKITPEEHANAHNNPDAGDGQDEGDDSGPPANESDRIDAIQEAVTELDVDNEKHFTAAGLPDARALSQVLGWTVTADERNKAFPGDDVKPKGKIKIKKPDTSEPLDTAAGVVTMKDLEPQDEGEGADSSTEGAVQV